MILSSDRFSKAITAFDTYNSNDPNKEEMNGETHSKEILYARRMTDRLNKFVPSASEPLQLAARCQHIGRWEIPRSNYPITKKGYLQWRSEEKLHHAQIAEKILISCGYDQATIDRVKFLLLKKELFIDPETQLLEDVVCLVFLEFYLDEFAAKHDGEKIIDIIRKTAKKMSANAIAAVRQLNLSVKMQSLLQQAVAPSQLFKFEEEFMKAGIRCIPMLVRFKLDACGIKLKLTEWNELTLDERKQLCLAPAKTEGELLFFKKNLQQIVFQHTGEATSDLAIDRSPAWSALDRLPDSLMEKLKEFKWSISVHQWMNLSNLQRFVLLKLSRPSHENKNFPKAMKEFGLVN